MNDYNSKAENKVLRLKLRYEPLLKAAPTFKEYKKLERSLETQIKEALGVPVNDLESADKEPK